MEYSQVEIKFGQFVSIVTHFPLFFLAFLMLHKKYYFEYILGISAVIFSFCYHLFDLSGSEVLMKPHDWHRLDNIFCISCFCLLVIEFINETRQVKLNLKVIMVMLTIVLQTREPFDLIDTILPILASFLLVLIFNLSKGGITVNLRTLAKGSLFMAIGVFFYVRGLDDDNDYLRLNHSVWHVFMVLGAFNLWQIGDKQPISLGDSTKYASRMISDIY